MKRVDLISYLAKTIIEYEKKSPVLIGIDGVDASGKTILAGEILNKLKQTERHVVSASIDHFHNPENVRYKRGRDSAEGYYFDSFNYEAMTKILLNPLSLGEAKFKTAFFDYRTNSKIFSPNQIATNNLILIMEGVFLFRPKLVNFWDIKIFVDVDFKKTIKRAVKRTAEIEHIGSEQEIIDKFAKRYIPGQKIYFKDAKPKEIADIIIDNNDFQNPKLKRER